MKEKLMWQIIVKQDEYIRHFKASYYHDSIAFRNRMFFFSRKVKRLTKELSDLMEQLKQAETEAEVAEIKATPMPFGWICPRCQKVHNWMVQHCDCSPNVITASTTEPKEVAEIKMENNCNNCKWGICLTKDWPCNDCNGSNKWEPIKTE